MLERKNKGQIHTWTEERLSAYMDNQLPPLERVRVERHLSECLECQRALSSLQWTVSLLKQAPAPVLSRSFLVPVPKQPARAPMMGISLLRLATAMATLLLISLVGFDLITQFGSSGLTSTASAPRVAVAPTIAAQVAPTEPAGKAQTAHDGLWSAATVPLAKATTAPALGVPPPAAPPTSAPKPTSAPAATVAPAISAPTPTLPPATTAASAAGVATAPFAGATAAPAAGATAAPAAGDIAPKSQTGAPSRPSVRALGVPGSPTPTILPGLGRGGGEEKSTLEGPAATAAPLQPQPHSLAVAPTATATATATETALPPTAAPTATTTPRIEALVQPTRGKVTPPPTLPPPEESALPFSPLRIAELGVLFVAVFLGALTLLLRR